MNDAEFAAVAALVGAAIGCFGSSLGPLTAGLIERRKDANRRQLAIVRELIGLFERLNRQHVPSEAIAHEEQFHLTDEIVVHALELADQQLRQHVAALVEGAVFALQPYLHPRSEFEADVSVASVGLVSLRDAARAILGPVLRGERVPQELPPGARGLIDLARRTNAETGEMIAILKGAR
jgi:hypothetical protein